MRNYSLRYIPTNYLIISLAVIYAIVQTKGISIALGALPIFFILYHIFNKEKAEKKYFEEVLIFVLIFVLNFFAVYSFEYQSLNLPHPDYHFYLKIANFFNELGMENNHTAKSYLFNEYSFSTPYRYFDTWLLSLLLRVLPFSDLIVLQLIYKPILYFLVANSINKTLFSIKKMSVRVLLSVLFIFFLGDSVTEFITRGSNIGREIALVSYPKLAVFFMLFIDFFNRQFFSNKEGKIESIFFIALLPILIQTSFPLYIFISFYLIYYFRFFYEKKFLILCIGLSVIYFTAFYGHNIILKNKIVAGSNMNLVTDVISYLKRIISISYQFFFKKIIFILIVFGVYFLNKNNKKQFYSSVIIFSGIMFSGVLIYALLPKTPNSYQLLTNLIYPCLIPLLLISITFVVKNKSNRFYFLISYIIICMFGLYHQYQTDGFFNNRHVINNKYDNDYVENVKKAFKDIEYPIGLTYWSENNTSRNKAEHFDQYGLDFLINIDGGLDVVCLSATQIDTISTMDRYLYNNSAVNYFNKRGGNKKDDIVTFMNTYPFKYLLSDLDKNYLPSHIKEKVILTIFDPKSKNYFHKFK